MITISLCMIVKNEESILYRCLASYKDLVDEIIIVDTGSTDHTKDIARKFTDNVFDFKWTGNFCDARNYSFSKATKDYIFCADADELMDEENKKKFMILKHGLLPEIDIVQMYYKNQLSHNTIYNYDMEYRPKLYKRIRHFVWEGAIHEAVRLNPIIYDSDIVILHCPTNLHTKRDVAVFESLTASGKRLDKRLHNIYAKELYISGDEEDFINSIPTFLHTMADETRSEDELKEAACVLAKACRINKEKENFFKYAMKAVAMNSCSEVCLELGHYYRSIKEYDEAIVWYYNAAFETESILKLAAHTTEPLNALALCYEKLGDMDSAQKYRAQAKEISSSSAKE